MPGTLIHSIMSAFRDRPVPAPGIQWAKGHAPPSMELVVESGNRQAYGSNMLESLWGGPSPVEKALGWEPNSVPYVFSVLGQVMTPYRASISLIV